MRPGLFDLLTRAAVREYGNDPLNWKAPAHPGYAQADTYLGQADAIRQQGFDLAAALANLAPPEERNVSFRTGDIVGALASGLFGGQEGLAGFLGGKGMKAERDSRNDLARYQQSQRAGGLQAEAMMQRANPLERLAQQSMRSTDQRYNTEADAFEARRRLAIDRREGALDRQSRERVAGANVQGRIDVAELNNATKLEMAGIRAKLDQFKADSGLWRTLKDLPNGEARARFAATTLRVTDPELLEALSKASPDEILKRENAALASERAKVVAPVAQSQIGRNNAQARYADARTQWVDDVARAQVRKADAAIRNYDSQINRRGADVSIQATKIRLQNVKDGIAGIDRELGQLRQGLRQAEKTANEADIKLYQQNIADLRKKKQDLMLKGGEMLGAIEAAQPLRPGEVAPAPIGSMGPLPAPTGTADLQGKITPRGVKKTTPKKTSGGKLPSGWTIR